MAHIQEIRKRNGKTVSFDASKIERAIWAAARAVGGRDRETAAVLAGKVVARLEKTWAGRVPHVEDVQDMVEKVLIEEGHARTAKAFILYRAERARARQQARAQAAEKARKSRLTVTKRSGATEAFNMKKLRACLERAARGLEKEVDLEAVTEEVLKNIYDGVKTSEIEDALVLAAAAFIERDPAYRSLAARLFLQKTYREVFACPFTSRDLDALYRKSFVDGIRCGVKEGLLDARMEGFDLEKLARALRPARDDLFHYMGVQILYERYFLRDAAGRRMETPQAFWMRVAMGLALQEKEKTRRAAEFYEVMSSLRFVPSTPTLFHAGTCHPQLSSCYLTTVEDDLRHIFKALSDNAQLSKWSGGLGNDWTNIRATGAWIRSTHVESQGVIPFLKIANDVTLAINRSGKRRGATCAYLETWHLDIEDFLDLRRNTGDERRRTHDMNTANWIPDLFMKRVLAGKTWTLFSPDEVPDLHHLYGKAFEEKYRAYEKAAREGKIRRYRIVSAVDLWKKMLGRLFETGHPWMTFKDPCNIRSPQDHAGVVHGSNLCTEITLNTSKDEIAVCNLGSVNLEKHVRRGKIQWALLENTVHTAMRMLDNVIDLNFYPVPEAEASNKRHRPVGLGMMGLQDALFKQGLGFTSKETPALVDRLTEFIAYHAILASSRLARERGPYPSYKGSKWDRGLFPQDTLALLEQERGVPVDVDRGSSLDWGPVRAHVKKHGMRNANTMAIAPTATISNIAGCYPSIEPVYKNIYVKSNISGEFTVVNAYLVEELKKRGLWSEEMLEKLKYYDGNLEFIAEVPDELKERFREVFDIDPFLLLELAARRGKWIDQSQSLNIFMKGVSGTLLSDIYTTAWKMGLKTTYYLRTLAASQIEKSTLGARYGFTQKRTYTAPPASAVSSNPQENLCEVCQ